MKVHFLGIGGVGMYALAERLFALGMQISGSDIECNELIDILKQKNINVYLKDTPLSVIEDCDVIIYSSAIKSGDINLEYAKKLNKCIYSRAQVLGEMFKVYSLSIGVAGSHGKTTCTSMIANILNVSNLSFTAFIGGADVNLNSYVYKGDNILLAEVCEYERNISFITPTVSVLLNIDDDHLDTYKTVKNLKSEFFAYLNRAKTKIINADDFLLNEYPSKNVLTYGVKNDCNYKGYDIKSNGGRYSFKCKTLKGEEFTVNLKVYGYHNIYNALSAIAVCDSLNIPRNIIKLGLENFNGVKRRFEFLGEYCGKKIIADYCHHPEEIKGTLAMAKEVFKGDYLPIFQPHTYSRTKLLFDKFISVFTNENVVIFKEYSAREKYDILGSAKRLSEGLIGSLYFEEIGEILGCIKSSKKNNVLILGAGNFYDKIKKYTKNYTV